MALFAVPGFAASCQGEKATIVDSGGADVGSIAGRLEGLDFEEMSRVRVQATDQAERVRPGSGWFVSPRPMGEAGPARWSLLAAPRPR